MPSLREAQEQFDCSLSSRSFEGNVDTHPLNGSVAAKTKLGITDARRSVHSLRHTGQAAPDGYAAFRD